MEKILMGAGVFSVGGSPVGLTRGGGKFVVEREFKQIEADGDMGPVKGRERLIKEVAKLSMNGLELFTAASLLKYFPALSNTIGTVTSTLKIADTDYNDITWVGKTMDGKACTITIQNAINLSNIDFGLVDKEEVLPLLEYTAHYLEDARTTAPWNIVLEQ